MAVAALWFLPPPFRSVIGLRLVLCCLGAGLAGGYGLGSIACLVALHVLSRKLARRIGWVVAAAGAAPLCGFLLSVATEFVGTYFGGVRGESP